MFLGGTRRRKGGKKEGELRYIQGSGSHAILNRDDDKFVRKCGLGRVSWLADGFGFTICSVPSADS